MIRSKKIQLVFMTAAFASCNQGTIPATSYNNNSYWFPYVNEDQQTLCDSLGCRLVPVPYEYYLPDIYLQNPFNYYTYLPVMKGTIVRKSRFILRSGWGHAWVSAS